MEVHAVERTDGARPGPDRGPMAAGASNLHEHLFAGDRVACDRSARRRREHRHEIGEPLDVAAVVVHRGCRVEVERPAVTLRASLFLEHRVGDPDLVEQGVGGELQQRRHLRLPAELADHIAAGREIEYHIDPAGCGLVSIELRLRDGTPRGVRNGVY
jgi:hypothetical protein